MLVAENLDAFRRLDLADVDGLVDFEMADVNDDLLGQILGQRAHLQLEHDVSKDAAVVLDAGGFAGGFHGHHDGDFFSFGNLVQIHMQHGLRQRMMLDFLEQREALGPGVALDGEIDEQVFRDGMVDEIFKFLGADFQALRFGVAAVDHGRNAPLGAEFFGPGSASERTGSGVQWYRFHFLKLCFGRHHQINWCARP